MDLSVRDAATQLGITPRAVRAMLNDGRLRGYKRGGQWIVPRRNLPLTEDQRRAAEHAITDLHAAVDEAVPPHIKRQLAAAGVAGLRPFESARAVFAALDPGPIRSAVRRGLRMLAEGHHQYDPAVKVAALTRARAHLSHAVADLLLAADDMPDAVRLAGVLEADVLPPLGGLLRRADAAKRHTCHPPNGMA